MKHNRIFIRIVCVILVTLSSTVNAQAEGPVCEKLFNEPYDSICSYSDSYCQAVFASPGSVTCEKLCSDYDFVCSGGWEATLVDGNPTCGQGDDVGCNYGSTGWLSCRCEEDPDAGPLPQVGCGEWTCKDENGANDGCATMEELCDGTDDCNDGGDEDCSNCELYCYSIINICTGDALEQFDDYDNCRVACAQYDDTGKDGDITGNSLQCRVTHLISAHQDKWKYCVSSGQSSDVCHGSVEDAENAASTGVKSSEHSRFNVLFLLLVSFVVFDN